jgi:hypothetical protein
MRKPRNTKTKTVDWRKLLPFRRTFEQKSFSAGKWVTSKDSLLFYSCSDEAERFIKTVYDAGIVENFDWPEWQSEAERLVADSKALQSANLPVLRKLLTTHLRKDHFCEGHLGYVFENGHILAILRRAEALLGKVRSKHRVENTTGVSATHGESSCSMTYRLTIRLSRIVSLLACTCELRPLSLIH